MACFLHQIYHQTTVISIKWFWKDFFKFMNNSVFGKNMKNLRDRRKVEIQCFSFYYCQTVGPVLKEYIQIDFIMGKIMNYVIYNKWQGLFQNKKNILSLDGTVRILFPNNSTAKRRRKLSKIKCDTILITRENMEGQRGTIWVVNLLYYLKCCALSFKHLLLQRRKQLSRWLKWSWNFPLFTIFNYLIILLFRMTYYEERLFIQGGFKVI